MLLRQRLPFRQYLSYSTLTDQKISLENVRTLENNPKNQSAANLGLYYSVSPEIKKQLFSSGGLPKLFEKQVKTFGEACLMIRQPALEVINYIKNTDFSKPTVRYVLYGKDGVGKSLTLSHILHYGFESEFLLVHVPWVPNWFKRPKETGNSVSKEGYIDLPLDAAAWLIQFKTQNSGLLSKLGLTVSKDYVWNKRETTPAGASITELIEHGIARVKFASDTIAALIYEIKLNSTARKCKTMVVIDGYNSFFYPHTRIMTENKIKVQPDKVTLTEPFLEITNHDWCNGVCILAVDQIALSDDRKESELPRYQLGENGFEHLDPFVPIRVDNYSDKEFISCIQYYLDRKWIQNNSKGFDNELKFLSGNNPFKLMQLTASL